MSTSYTPQDALTYTREQLKLTLDWVHEYLADSYGLETIDGEEYLPEPLSDVLSALLGVEDELTTMCVEVRAYRRNAAGSLMRPVYYSNRNRIYVERAIGEPDDWHLTTELENPNGAPRRGLRVVNGGGTNE